MAETVYRIIGTWADNSRREETREDFASAQTLACKWSQVLVYGKPGCSVVYDGRVVAAIWNDGQQERAR